MGAGNEADVASKTKPVGGGGTDVRCVPEYLKQHKIKPQASIVFTDGHLYGGWGEWDHPVLWVIVDNPNATPDHGAVLHVDSGGHPMMDWQDQTNLVFTAILVAVFTAGIQLGWWM